MTSQPRLMTGAEAAAFCSVTPNTWSSWVASGKMPRPVLGTRRWDRKAIDMALDKASGITAPSIVPDEDPYEAWKRQNEAEQ